MCRCFDHVKNYSFCTIYEATMELYNPCETDVLCRKNIHFSDFSLIYTVET